MARVGLIRAATTMAWESPRDCRLQCDGSPFHGILLRMMERGLYIVYQHCTIPPIRSSTKVNLVVATEIFQDKVHALTCCNTFMSSMT